MSVCRPPPLTLALLALCLCVLRPGALAAADSLVWHKQPERVDADIRNWNVPQLLEHLAAATGWRVYLDPGAVQPVSAKFSALPVPEALHSLLGNLNFLIVPQSNSAPHLYVFEPRGRRPPASSHPRGRPPSPFPTNWS